MEEKLTKAFTLAEMLMVLLIMSLIIVALAPLSVKKIKKNTTRQPHGVYECYYNSDGKLTQTVTYEGKRSMTTHPSQCVFDTTAGGVVGASFFLVSAVGGGGGGAFAKQETTITSGFTLNNDYTVPLNGTVDFSGYNDSVWEKVYNYFSKNYYTVTYTISSGKGRDGADFTQKTLEHDSDCNGVACTYSDAHYGGTAGKGSTTNVSAKLTQGTQITSDYKRLEYPQDASITIENGFGGTSTSATCKGGGDGTDATSLKDGTAGSRGYCTPSTYGYSTTSGVSVSPSTIEIVRSFDKFLNWYGAAGSAGEAKTLLFPKFRAPIVITLGAGGAGATSSSESGEDGGATTIQYEGETSPFFVLEGGLGGGTLSAPGRYTEVTMQKPYYLNDTGFLYFVKERLSGFSTLSGAENIPESSGAGGHGGFTIFRNLDSLLYKYTVGSYNIGNSYVWEYADNPVVCGTGSTTEKYCSGMNGTNGALVIVW